MRPDVSSLKLFYQSAIGRGAAFCLANKIRHHWQDMNNADIMGLGYPTPLFDQMMATGAEFLALMPGGQGAVVWPSKSHGRCLMVDEYHLPIADSSAERLILIHALEYAQTPAALLREVWRVLKPGGVVITVVPNRRRTWSTFEHTPFGHGTPYSKEQLTKLLEEQLLFPTYISSALMMPPMNIPAIEKLIRVSETTLKGSFDMLGGLLFIEAEKRVYGTIAPAKEKRQAIRVLKGA